MSDNNNAQTIFYNSHIYSMAMQTSNQDKNIIRPSFEEAAADFQNGIEEAYNYLLHCYDKKFKYNAMKYNDEDVYQELSIVLLKCAQAYKTGKNANFNTFLWSAAQNKLGALHNSKHALKRTPQNGIVSLNAEDSETGDEYIELQEDESSLNDARDIEYNLFLQQSIYPLIDNMDRNIIAAIIKGLTVTDIAHKYDVTTACIYSHLRRLRNNKKIYNALHQYD